MIVIGPGIVILTGLELIDWLSCHSLGIHGSWYLWETCDKITLKVLSQGRVNHCCVLLQ